MVLSTSNLAREVVDNFVTDEDLEIIEQEREDATNPGTSTGNESDDRTPRKFRSVA